MVREKVVEIKDKKRQPNYISSGLLKKKNITIGQN